MIFIVSLFCYRILVRKSGRNTDNLIFMEKGKRKKKSTSDELRALVCPFDNEDGLDLDHGPATRGPPGCIVRPHL
jgi:hypothetical protein